jgi:hypothetical protein
MRKGGNLAIVSLVLVPRFANVGGDRPRPPHSSRETLRGGTDPFVQLIALLLRNSTQTCRCNSSPIQTSRWVHLLFKTGADNDAAGHLPSMPHTLLVFGWPITAGNPGENVEINPGRVPIVFGSGYPD